MSYILLENIIILCFKYYQNWRLFYIRMYDIIVRCEKASRNPIFPRILLREYVTKCINVAVDFVPTPFPAHIDASVDKTK